MPTELLESLLTRTLPVLMLMVAGAWAIRRRASTPGLGKSITVVSRTGLSRGAIVAEIAIGERRFLVGATDQAVSLLAELDKQTSEETDTPMRPRMDLVRQMQQATLRRPNHQRPPRVTRS